MSRNMPLNEAQIIEKYFAPLSGGDPAARGFKDDCALLSFGEKASAVISTDMLVAGVHFFAGDNAADIGWKALSVNISDLIASGGQPRQYLLSLALDAAADEAWIAGFASGLKEAQDRFRISLIGGDTTRSTGPLAISVTALGDVPEGDYTGRDGARVDDLIYVTGSIGDGFLGCAIRRDEARTDEWGLSAEERDHLLKRYHRPQPRLEMLDPVRRFATAAMDISDGLVLDLTRLCSASGCGGVIKAPDVPLSQAARQVLKNQPDRLASLLSGGDDYELLMTVAPRDSAAFEAAAHACGVEVTQIGVCTGPAGKVECLEESGARMIFERSGYDHFSDVQGK